MDRQTDGSRYRLMPPYGGGHNIRAMSVHTPNSSSVRREHAFTVGAVMAEGRFDRTPRPFRAVAIKSLVASAVASTRVQGWGDEPCEPTVRLPDWSELVASYSRMKSAWGWANGRQPILVCYIRKYVIILGGYSRWRPATKILGCVPGIPGGVDASATLL